jgi:pyruvate formate lyase activating enzyme
VIEELAIWIKNHLGEKTPLHLSAYHPQYKMNRPRTSSGILEKAYAVCREHLSHVYTGNIATSVGRDTECASCGSLLISRQRYSTSIVDLADGLCRKCGARADIN